MRLFLLIGFLLFTITSFGQYWGYGPKAAFNIGSMYGQADHPNDTYSSRFGFSGGAYFKYIVEERRGININLMYSQAGRNYNKSIQRVDTSFFITENIGGIDSTYLKNTFYSSNYEGSIKLNYFEISAMPIYRFGGIVGLGIGPRLGVLLNGSNIGSGTEEIGDNASQIGLFLNQEDYLNALIKHGPINFDESNKINKLDLGIAVSTEIYFTNAITVFGTASMGISSIFKNTRLFPSKNYNFIFQIGVQYDITSFMYDQ